MRRTSGTFHRKADTRLSCAAERPRHAEQSVRRLGDDQRGTRRPPPLAGNRKFPEGAKVTPFFVVHPSDSNCVASRRLARSREAKPKLCAGRAAHFIERRTPAFRVPRRDRDMPSVALGVSGTTNEARGDPPPLAGNRKFPEGANVIRFFVVRHSDLNCVASPQACPLALPPKAEPCGGRAAHFIERRTPAFRVPRRDRDMPSKA